MTQKSWFKEPFIHFVFLGIILFIGHSLWSRGQSDDTTILIETAEMERQALIFAGENRREPSDADLNALFYAFVEEEVLVREGLKRGLDQGDTIIRRRLAQKMRFIIEDVTTLPDPGEAELKAWFTSRKSEFSTPETLSFTHIYLSPERRGDGLMDDTKTILAEIKANPNLDPLTLGDPFMLQKQFKDVTRSNISGLFGADFANGLFDQADKNTAYPDWRGQTSSPFGVHIIRIDSFTPTQTAEFEDVKDRVKANWTDLKTREVNQAALKDLIKKYEVKIEGEDE